MSKFVGLELLRGLAAIWVMLFHYKQVYPDVDYIYPYVDNFISKGGLGVEMFFILSGLIISLRYQSSFGGRFCFVEFYNYMVKRASRILPLHMLCTTVMVLGALVLSRLLSFDLDGTRFDLKNVFASMFLLSFYFDSVIDINMPAWTLSAEMLIYILLPFAFYISNLKSNLYVVLLALCLIVFAFFDNSSDPMYRLFCGYLFGLLSASIFRSDVEVGKLVSYAFFGLILYFSTGWYLVLLFTFGFILILSCKINYIFVRFSILEAICVWVGRLSFPIYIVHWPVRTYVRSVVDVLNLNIDNAWLISIYCGLSLVLAIVLHVFFEEPVRKIFVNKLSLQSAKGKVA